MASIQDGTASSGSAAKPRRRSSSSRTLASVGTRRSPFSPSALASSLVKNGKYIVSGAAGIWWLDLRSAVDHVLEASNSWAKRSLFVAGGMLGVTVSIFLYLMLFLPWCRGYVPNYPKWQQSRRLRVIFPVLTVAILVGWSCLVFSLSHSSHPQSRGPLRDAIRAALDVDEKEGLGVWSSILGATAVYTLVFGVLGLIPSPASPIRIKRQ